MNRNGCRDVFHASLVKHASYGGLFEFPKIHVSNSIPNRLIPFSKAISSTDYDQWVHFYEDDYLFERIWRNPKKYISILRKFRGVISPDFSLYRDMPFAMQIWNLYRSRAIGFWLQDNGIDVIPNIRFGDSRTYRICCDGIEQHSVIAIGTHGSMRQRVDRCIMLEGVSYVVKRIQPSAIIVYGSASEQYWNQYLEDGINIIRFDSIFSTSHREVI